MNISYGEYGKPEYWEELYKENEGHTYDWLHQSYKPFRNLLVRSATGLSLEYQLCIEEKAQMMQILHVGCGNSVLPEEMHDIDKF